MSLRTVNQMVPPSHSGYRAGRRLSNENANTNVLTINRFYSMIAHLMQLSPLSIASFNDLLNNVSYYIVLHRDFFAQTCTFCQYKMYFICAKHVPFSKGIDNIKKK